MYMFGCRGDVGATLIRDRRRLDGSYIDEPSHTVYFIHCVGRALAEALVEHLVERLVKLLVKLLQSFTELYRAFIELYISI